MADQPQESGVLGGLRRRLAAIPQHTRLAYFNMTNSWLDGVLDAIAMGMVPVATTIVYFMAGYVQSAFLLGLLTAMRVLFCALGELLCFFIMNGRPLYKWGFFWFSLALRLTWLFEGLLILFFGAGGSNGFVIGFYVLTAIQGFCQGGTHLTWTSQINKVITPHYRARFIGFRSASCMAGSALGAMAATAITNWRGDSFGFAVLFLVASCIDFTSLVPLMLVKEKPDQTQGEQRPDLRQTWAVLKPSLSRPDFRRHLICVGAIMCAFAAFPFQTQFVKELYGLTATQLGGTTLLMLLGQCGGYLIGGWLQGKRGYRGVQLLGFYLMVLYLVAVQLARTPVGFIALAGLYGASNALVLLCVRNIVVYLVLYQQRMACFMAAGVISSLSGAVFPMLCGYLYDTIGFRWMCLAMLLPAVLAILFGTRIHETTLQEPT